MYDTTHLLSIFFGGSIVLLILFYIVALVIDENSRRNISKAISEAEDRAFKKCTGINEDGGKDFSSCVIEENNLNQKIKHQIHFSNTHSKTKKMIIDSLGGSFRGAIIGYLIGGPKPAIITSILFFVLDPVIGFITNIFPVKLNL